MWQTLFCKRKTKQKGYMSESNTLVQKLARVTSKIGKIEKEGQNSFHGYKYITEGQISAVLRRYLSDEGIFFRTDIHDVTTTCREVPKGYERFVDVKTKHTFSDGVSEITIDGYGQAVDLNGDKALYKAVTGATKYALMKTFLISDGNDPEADHEVDLQADETQRESQQRQSQKQEERFPEKPKHTPSREDMEIDICVWMEQKAFSVSDVIEALTRRKHLTGKETCLQDFPDKVITGLMNKSWRDGVELFQEKKARLANEQK
jgi:hypothetical protein